MDESESPTRSISQLSRVPDLTCAITRAWLLQSTHHPPLTTHHSPSEPLNHPPSTIASHPPHPLSSNGYSDRDISRRRGLAAVRYRHSCILPIRPHLALLPSTFVPFSWPVGPPEIGEHVTCPAPQILPTIAANSQLIPLLRRCRLQRPSRVPNTAAFPFNLPSAAAKKLAPTPILPGS